MLDAIRRLIRGSGGENAPSSDPNRDVRIATCAILLEIARIDGVLSSEEEAVVITALKNDLEVPAHDIQEIMETARKELEGSIDLWQFTNRINQSYSIAEKERILEWVWTIALSDRILDRHEDYLAHKLGDLLRLDHRQLMEAKMRASRRTPSSKPPAARD